MRRSIPESSKPDVAARIPAWAAQGAAVILWGAAAPLALIAPKTLQILVWLLPLASFAGLDRSRFSLRGLALTPLSLVMAVPLFALIAAPFSVDPMETAIRALRLVLELAALCLLFTSTAASSLEFRRRALNAVMIGVAVSGAVILVDLATRGALLTPFWGAPPTWEWRRIAYNRGETTLAMLAPTAVLILTQSLSIGDRRRLVWSVAALVLGAAAIYAGASNSAKVAFILGLVVFALVFALPALLRGLLWTCALATLALPWVIDAVPPRPLIEQSGASLQSIVHRTIIWDFTIARIKERPLLGWGLDASRRMPGGDEEVTMSGFNKAGGVAGQREEMSGQVMPLHPHNGVLQIWLELGGLGAGLVAGLIALAGWFVGRARLSRLASAATAASFAAGYAIALVSYGLWQGWWLAALFLMAALPALMRSERNIMKDSAFSESEDYS